MYSKVNYTIVGLFVILFGIGMVWFAFWLAKYGLKEEFVTYRVELKESVSGLSKDSSVKLHGVEIGRVSQIRIHPQDVQKVELILEINEAVLIKEDMVAHTQMFGITGLLFIEIEGGSNEAKTLVPTDEYIPLISSKPSLLTKLSKNVGGLSEKLENLLAQSEKLLSDQNVETMGSILDNTEKLTAKGSEVEDKALKSLEEIDKTLQEFRVTMKNINMKLTEASDDFAQIKEVTVPTVEKLMETSKNFNRVTLKVEKSLDRGDYNLKKILEPAIIDTQILLKELSTVSRELEQNPSGILFKSRESRRGPGE
ncbi:MlaD family protein [Sulfurovum sp.]|uniref:MlaD family protein n=1 Tax=Sulfurovum sp. TaxID=1969726 RepID=UPI0028681F7A|nr:MlaD family protein [Sulfurovum sp.]